MGQVYFVGLGHGTVCAVEALGYHAEDYATRPEAFGTAIGQLLGAGSAVQAEQYQSALGLIQGFRDRFRVALSEVDGLVGPSGGAHVAVDREGQYGSIGEAMPVAEGTSRTEFTFPSNFAGTPSLSLPCGATGGGLPLTMQLQGAPLSEATLCRIGHAYEQATEWNSLHPDV